MIQKSIGKDNQDRIQKVLSDFPGNFSCLGKLRHHQVKFHIDPSVKPVAVPPRPTPYHLRERIKIEIQ